VTDCLPMVKEMEGLPRMDIMAEETMELGRKKTILVRPRVAVALLLAFLGISAFAQSNPADGPWSGSIQCQLDVQQQGYERHETQTWKLTSSMPVGKNGDMRLYSAVWSVTGQGGYQRAMGQRASLAQWNINVPPANASVAMFVRASDGQFIIRIWQRPVPLNTGINAMRQIADNRVAQQPARINSTVQEWMLPWILVNPAGNIRGKLSVPVESLGADLTPSGLSPMANCAWQFSRTANTISDEQASTNARTQKDYTTSVQQGWTNQPNTLGGAAAGGKTTGSDASAAGAAKPVDTIGNAGAAAGGKTTGSDASAAGAAKPVDTIGNAGAAAGGKTTGGGASAAGAAKPANTVGNVGAAAGAQSTGASAKDGAAPLTTDSQSANAGAGSGPSSATLADVANYYDNMQASIQEEYAKLIGQAQADSKAPGLTPEKRKALQNQIAELQSGELAALKELSTQKNMALQQMKNGVALDGSKRAILPGGFPGTPPGVDVAPIPVTKTGVGGPPTKSTLESATVVPLIPVMTLASPIKQVTPNSGSQGAANLSVVLTGSFTNFVQGTTTVDFGPGITVNSLTVTPPNSVTALLNVAPAATIGPRDIKVTNGTGSTILPQSFNVAPTFTATLLPATVTLPAVAQVRPNSGMQAGTNITMTITGNNATHFSESTKVDFGAGISAGPLTNVTNNSAQTTLTIASGAATGARTVTLTTGTEVAKLANGFTVLPYATNTPASFQVSLHGLSYNDSQGRHYEGNWCDATGCSTWAQGGDTVEMNGTFQPGDELHVILGQNGADETLFNKPQWCDDNGDNCRWAVNFTGSATPMPWSTTAATPAHPIPALIYVRRGNQHSNLLHVTYGPPLKTIQVPPTLPNYVLTSTNAGFGADFYVHDAPSSWGSGTEVQHRGGFLGGGKGDDVWYDGTLNDGWYIVSVDMTCNWNSPCVANGYGLGGAAMLATPVVPGSTNPRITVHWWVEASGFSTYTIHSITLVGPEGTQPFRVNGH
jgi:hypothetical protein